MHLQMDLIPDRVVQGYHHGPHQCADEKRGIPGDHRQAPQSQTQGQGFHEPFTEIEADSAILARRQRFVVKRLAILCVVLYCVAREDFLPRPQVLEEEVAGLLVHQPAVNLVLDQRHHHDQGGKPANDRKNLQQHDAFTP